MELAPGMIIHSRLPLNAEPPLQLLDTFVTPDSTFYVRSHGATPVVDANGYRLQVRASATVDLSMAELKQRFPVISVMATLQCAGNRRADQQSVRRTLGDPWMGGAIGNAVWTGVRLADVLHNTGAAGEHVAFEALDEVDGHCFGVSIPIAKAMSPEVVLAWAMNGAPLEPRHGGPLRIVVPGYAGVRSVKWVRRITVQREPSDAPMQATDYRLLPPDVTEANVDWSQGQTINAMPVNSAICDPAPNTRLPAGTCSVRGWAMASGRMVARVDVSADCGRTWRQASLTRDPAQPWAWTLWHATLELPPGEHELAVRAWDDAGQTQPADAADTWNFKGYLSAAWHRVPITVV